MAISDELNRIIQAKADIKSALEDKGLTIGDSSTLDEFAGLIEEWDPWEGYEPVDPEPEPEPEPELEQLSPPEITITPDRDGYTVEITNTDQRANAIVYSIGDPNENEIFDYTETLLNISEGTEIYAQARDENGEYAESDWSSAVVGE